MVLMLPTPPPKAIARSTGLIEQNDFRPGGMLVGVPGPALIIGWMLILDTLKGTV